MSFASDASHPLLLTVEEAAERLGIRRTLMYSLVSSGAVRSVVVGRRLRRIPAEALHEYVRELSDEQNKDGTAA